MPSLDERFWSKVDKTGECWEWTAYRFPKGYGGLQVCHTCDNPPCVRPDHLFLGTNAENMEDRRRKGRAGKILTWDDVREIRRLYAAGGVKQVELARRFGVKPAILNQIIHHNRWSPDPLVPEGTTERDRQNNGNA